MLLEKEKGGREGALFFVNAIASCKSLILLLEYE